ncbi:MAG: S-layer homology domain-containing protein [Thermoleophilia bacterium]|nr:S-layer homology domain-containing protein [Thermoleophilia bacterium]
MSVHPGIRTRGAAAKLPLPAALVFLAAMVFSTVLLLCSTPAQALVPLPDYNEPNDSPETATLLENGVTQWGAIVPGDDVDFFYIDIPGSRQVTVDFTTGGYPKECRVALQASGSDEILDVDWEKNYDDDASFFSEGTVGPGRLFAVVYVEGGQDASTAAFTITVTYSGGGTTGFPDVPAGSEYYEAVTYLADENVVSGYADGRFGPRDLVMRQQFAKMIVRAIGYPVFTSDDCPFGDVPKSSPGHYVDPKDPLYPDHYVAVAAAHHITVGVTPTSFGPYRNITLAQVVTMVVRSAQDLGLWDAPPHAYQPPFADFGQPHYPYARMGAAHGLFDGYPGPWDWSKAATRGQCAFFIWKLMVAYHGAGGAGLTD